MKKVIAKEYDPKTGKFEPITLTPEELAEMREQVFKRFYPDGRDKLLLPMIERCKQPSKPKSPPAA